METRSVNLVRWVLLVPYLLVVAAICQILQETIFLHWMPMTQQSDFFGP